MVGEIIESENLHALDFLYGRKFSLIYIDPPFNTGKKQVHRRIRTERDETGDRTGFAGNRYASTVVSETAYEDTFDDYIGFLEERVRLAYDLLEDTGSFFLHLDYREVHYAKVMMDRVFGRDCFQNEIIWAYDYGARSKSKWPTKHDTILWYSKHPGKYTFNLDASDRIPYMAPGLVGAEKAERGKTPTDVWWHTIVPTNGKERTGYATQKPAGLLRRLIAVHTHPGDAVLDFFAGSGTTGEVAGELGRSFVMVDENPQAIAVMQKRLARFNPSYTATRPWTPEEAALLDSYRGTL